MTDLPHLASRLYGTPLLIAAPKLEVILGVMARKWAGEPMLAAETSNSLARGVQITETGIAVIPILGTLVRRSSYIGAASGLTSYHDIEALAESAFADPEVKAVLLEIDSGGGEAGGVFDLATRLRSLAKASGKPLWAIADEAALSAAYALACAADRLWLTRTAEVGSIGVVAVHVDESAADAQAGLAYTFIHAGANKVDGHGHAPLTAQVSSAIQADIDSLFDHFVTLVAEHRRLAPATIRATEARVYRGESAIAAGLADQIGSLREAMAALERVIAAPNRSTRKPNTAFTHRPLQETSMSESTAVILDDTLDDTPEEELPSADAPAVPTTDSPAVADETTITAQIEQRLRQQMAEITEIAAQAKRLGIAVDPAQAIQDRISPDALRKTVLKQAAERDAAQDIVVQSSFGAQNLSSLADSPLVKAARQASQQPHQ